MNSRYPPFLPGSSHPLPPDFFIPYSTSLKVLGEVAAAAAQASDLAHAKHDAQPPRSSAFQSTALESPTAATRSQSPRMFTEK